VLDGLLNNGLFVMLCCWSEMKILNIAK